MLFIINKFNKNVDNKQRKLKTIFIGLLPDPEKIHSDKLKQYKSLISKKTHNVKQYTINKIEGKFLNFHTHLKCLSHKTICFSKKAFMLEVKIYIWNSSLIF